MKNQFTVLLIAFGVLSSSSSAFGPQGHKLVGDVAALRLSAETAEKVSKLLDGIPLGEAALIPDEIKDWDKGGDDVGHGAWGLPGHSRIENELQEYWEANRLPTKENPGEPLHRQFHFTDIPVKDVEKYQQGKTGRSNHDLVQMISYCVQVLKGKIPESNDRKITKSVAVILLAHFVGDIHQPLHVGAEYFSANGAKVNPDVAGQKGFPDMGGNSIKIAKMDRVKIPADIKSRFYPQLHGIWDGEMVAEAIRQMHADAGPGKFSAAHFLAENEPSEWKFTQEVPPESWSLHWANQIQPIAREAHERLNFGKVTTSTRNKVTTAHTFAAERADMPGYIQWGGGVIRLQLGRAGWRLAALLEQCIE